jgi:hypothetical protein
MPKTKKQGLVFALLMGFSMVFCMTVYTIALGQGALSGGVFALAIREMWVEFVVIELLVNLVVTRLALKIAMKIVPETLRGSFFMTLAVQSATVALIVPVITLFATFMHGGAGGWFCRWIATAALCFPAAFFLQIFYVGPLVRAVFRGGLRAWNAIVKKPEIKTSET